jgi:hypothetical protein
MSFAARKQVIEAGREAFPRTTVFGQSNLIAGQTGNLDP